jgi:DNA-directed RNA polymerase specialized sigma24 family protein
VKIIRLERERSMNSPGSVTVWLDRLKNGDDRNAAVARLWERYFSLLVGQARNHLRGKHTLADGEDVALSAFDKFVRAVEAGRFPKLNDRTDLWQVLLRLTANRASNAIRDEGRDKRGGGSTSHPLGEAEGSGMEVEASDPDPAEVVAFAEQVENMLAVLGNQELQQVAVLALEGRTNEEIATSVGKAIATVERKLKRIREVWGNKGYGPDTGSP